MFKTVFILDFFFVFIHVYMSFHFYILKECLGIIFENENCTDGIANVMRHIQEYIPKVNEGNEIRFHEAGVVGDQLTVERVVNSCQYPMGLQQMNEWRAYTAR